MKNLTLFLLIISSNSFAENSRSPAVLASSCNLNIPTTVTEVVGGKEVVKERPVEDVLKEQCKEVRKCMNSAGDEEMDELKKLEGVACNNTLMAVTTKTPSPVVDKNFDGKRNAKPNLELERTTDSTKSNSISK